ncbi:MAG: DegT/DnrJ/EryC1/StrS family aminotransferase, partial [Deltaproteobacteria bacterium]|nr:DegT/DnrJ/EryC1/StrS family aminotransferase [Deltaproteobacteria bacterium]
MPDERYLNRPRRQAMLPFCPPDIGQEEIDEVVDSLKSGWITTGPKVAKFEQELAAYVGARHAMMLNSATSGLFLCLKALNIGPGDEVITTPYTFAASVNVILHAGARPVLVDVKKDDFNIDPELIEKAVTPKTRAVIPVHYAGRSCDMEAIGALAKKHNLTVIEDAAHAIGTEYQGKKTGSISRFTVFSFHAVKNVTTGEGGAVTTDDTAMAEKIKVMSLHGMNKDAWKRYAPGGKVQYDIVYPGYKFNMTDLQAGLGIHQLRKLERTLEKRRAIAARYREGFKDLPQLTLSGEDPDGRNCWHLYPLLLNLEKLSIDRNQVIELLKQENVSSNIHYTPVHLFSYAQEYLGYQKGDFPQAERLGERELT